MLNVIRKLSPVINYKERIRVSLFRLKKFRYHYISLMPIAAFIFFLRFFIKKDGNRILVINAGGIGDILMMAPLAKALSARYEVDLLVNDEAKARIFKTQSIYKNVYSMDFVGAKQFITVKSRFQMLFKVFCFYPSEYLRLSKRNYGIGINCCYYGWVVMIEASLLNALSIPKTIGFYKNNDLLLKMQQHTDNEINLTGPSFYLSLLKYFDIGSDYSKDLYFEIDEESKRELKKILKKISIVQGDKKIAVLHPGGKIHNNSRWWPAEYYREIAQYLAANNYYVLISGTGEVDREVCGYVSQNIAHCYNLWNRLFFNQLAALLAEADLCISNDTSTVHLAGAVRCRMLIAIYGPTNSKFLSTTNKKHFVVKSDLECSPCRESMLTVELEKPCPRLEKIECLRRIKPSQIIKLIEEHGTSEN